MAGSCSAIVRPVSFISGNSVRLYRWLRSVGEAFANSAAVAATACSPGGAVRRTSPTYRSRAWPLAPSSVLEVLPLGSRSKRPGRSGSMS